jgi:hypothetical protein
MVPAVGLVTVVAIGSAGVAPSPVSVVREAPASTSPVTVSFSQAIVWCWHVPAAQESSVQESPSKQLSGVLWQPLAGLQESMVQALLSSQLSEPPETQVPDWHVSSDVQASPSLHPVPSVTGP